MRPQLIKETCGGHKDPKLYHNMGKWWNKIIRPKSRASAFSEKVKQSDSLTKFQNDLLISGHHLQVFSLM